AAAPLPLFPSPAHTTQYTRTTSPTPKRRARGRRCRLAASSVEDQPATTVESNPRERVCATMREKVPSPNAPQSLEELRSSSSPRRGKRSCSRRTSHRRASWLPMKEPREPLPSQRRGTRERGAVSVVAVTAVDSQEIQGNPSSGLIFFWF
ncbi:hypothetical protein S245_037234, partial [Arachis hypogaea]